MLSKPPSSHPEIPKSRRLALLTRARNPSRFVRLLYLHPSLAELQPNGSIGESVDETLVDASYFFTEKRWREYQQGLGPMRIVMTPTSRPHIQLAPLGLSHLIKMVVLPSLPQLVVAPTSWQDEVVISHMGAGYWAEAWNPKASILNCIWKKLRKREKTYAV